MPRIKRAEPLTPAELAYWRIRRLRQEFDKKILDVLMELEAVLPAQREIVTESADQITDPVTGKVYPIKRGKKT